MTAGPYLKHVQPNIPTLNADSEHHKYARSSIVSSLHSGLAQNSMQKMLIILLDRCATVLPLPYLQETAGIMM